MFNCKNCGKLIEDNQNPCPHCHYDKVKEKFIDENSNLEQKDEKSLINVGSFILALGIIGSIILFIGGCVYFSGNEIETIIGLYMFGMILPLIIPSIAVYALFKVISNISVSLKNMKTK